MARIGGSESVPSPAGAALGRPGAGSRRRGTRVPSSLLSLLSLLPALPFLPATPGAAQEATYRLRAPSGAEVAYPEEALREMLDTTRALRRDLEEDPEILYFTGVGPAVSLDAPEPAFPWNAIEVLTDSTATIRTPGNLREADRAYGNYAVVRMRMVGMDPDVSCDSLMAREVAAAGAFVQGWVVTRTLFGGPPFPPLDELVFAREAGHLAGLVAAGDDSQLGGCLAVWSAAHPKEVESYRRWREEAFLPPGEGAGGSSATPGAGPGSAPVAGEQSGPPALYTPGRARRDGRPPPGRFRTHPSP